MSNAVCWWFGTLAECREPEKCKSCLDKVQDKSFKFKKNPKYVHQRSEGLTRRGQGRQERLMLGKRGTVARGK